MASNTYKTRVQMKNDTAENWSKATGFTPLQGEIIVYSDLNKIKVGDGSTNVNDLPFITGSASSSGGTDEVYIGSTQPTGGQEIWIDTSDDTGAEGEEETYITTKDLEAYALKTELFSKSYNDLTDKPTLFSGSYTDLTNKPTTVAVSTSISAASTDSNAVTPKAVYDYVQTAITSLPTVYTGDTTPDSTIGNNGDLYLIVEG